MQLQKLKLCDIVPYDNNPRKNDEAVKLVAESIKQCSYIAPIIVDEDGVILAGHTRYKALQQLGYKEAEVIVKNNLTSEQKRNTGCLTTKQENLPNGILTFWHKSLKDWILAISIWIGVLILPKEKPILPTTIIVKGISQSLNQNSAISINSGAIV